MTLRKKRVFLVNLFLFIPTLFLCKIEGFAYSTETYDKTEYRRISRTLWWKRRPSETLKQHRFKKVDEADTRDRSSLMRDSGRMVGIRPNKENGKFIEGSEKQAQSEIGYRRISKTLLWKKRSSKSLGDPGPGIVGTSDAGRHHASKKINNEKIVSDVDMASSTEVRTYIEGNEILDAYHALKKLRKDETITDSEFRKRRMALIRRERSAVKTESIQVAAYSKDDEYGEYGEFREDPEDNSYSETPDTFEKFNRVMYKANDFFYDNVMDPLVKGYTKVTPESFRNAVKNFFSNISMPVKFLSSMAQGSWEKSGRVLSRFLINSTIGIGGLFDVAKTKFNIEKVDEDFGQALGHYGVKTGPYLVLPLFGPSTIRGTAGLGMDTVVNPIRILSPGIETNVGITAGEKTSDIAQNPNLKKDIDDMAVDPYLSVRDLYLQQRKGKVEE